MVLARTIDEAGGDGFAIEYAASRRHRPSARASAAPATSTCAEWATTASASARAARSTPPTAQIAGDLSDGVALVAAARQRSIRR